MRLASNDVVLNLDDDAFVIDGGAVRHARRRCSRSIRRCGAVACAQAEADGSPWPAAMQPSPARISVLRDDVHRFCACAAANGVSRARRLPRVVSLLRRGEGLLPASAERRVRRCVPARRASRARAGSLRTQQCPLPALRRSERLPERVVQRTAADGACDGADSRRAIRGHAPTRTGERSGRLALGDRRTHVVAARHLAHAQTDTVGQHPALAPVCGGPGRPSSRGRFLHERPSPATSHDRPLVFGGREPASCARTGRDGRVGRDRGRAGALSR